MALRMIRQSSGHALYADTRKGRSPVAPNVKDTERRSVVHVNIYIPSDRPSDLSLRQISSPQFASNDYLG